MILACKVSPDETRYLKGRVFGNTRGREMVHGSNQVSSSRPSTKAGSQERVVLCVQGDLATSCLKSGYMWANSAVIGQPTNSLISNTQNSLSAAL